MLRITPITDGDSILLKVDGKLLEPWLGELRTACANFGTQSKQMKLDLANVTYVDAAAARFLQTLVLGGIHITACSNFVAALLAVEKA